MPTINIGFITFSLIRLLRAVGFWKRKGIGSENPVCRDAGAELHAAVAVVWPGFLSPLARHYDERKFLAATL
jgi:hypothetical protein